MEELRSVGQVADLTGVTVRALHHWDAIGLLVPSERSSAGYRLYAASDLDRLHRVLLYRRLGFSLEEITALLDDPAVSLDEHLRRQHRLVVERIDELDQVRIAVEKMMGGTGMGIQLTREEQFEVFGEDWPNDEHTAEAERRWGDTEAWAQSQARTSTYDKGQWEQITEANAALEQELVRALQEGQPADGEVARDVAERMRLHLDRWFFDCSREMHRCLGEMYVGDERFAAHYDALAPGLAAYVRDAVVANADRG